MLVPLWLLGCKGNTFLALPWVCFGFISISYYIKANVRFWYNTFAFLVFVFQNGFLFCEILYQHGLPF